MVESKDSKNSLNTVSDAAIIQRQQKGSVVKEGKSNNTNKESGDNALDDLEDKKKFLENQEIEQKIKIRERVTNLVAGTIKFMAGTLIAGIAIFVLAHLLVFCLADGNALKTFIMGSNVVSYFIALAVAPITAIAAINVALLYGAFKKSKEADGESIIKNAPTASNLMQGDSSGL